MESSSVQSDLRARALAWLKQDPDEDTRAELQHVLDHNDEAGLSDRFSSRLEFGTAGLRGVLGAGPNRMNRVVVAQTTAGLCRYLQATTPDAAQRGIVIGYDARKMSRRFAEDTAEICAGHGQRAFLFPDIVATPLLAFAVRALNAAAGVMVTASHNPPEYNGYKVYWGNGAQIIPPHDAGISSAIESIHSLLEIPHPILKEARARGLVLDVPPEVEENYFEALLALQKHPGIGRDLRIAYTPLHGVGDRFAHTVLARAGFANVTSVAAQAAPDGAFPTVAFPNPEEKGAMDLVLELAHQSRADLVIANDPDADRLSVAVPTPEGSFRQLSGNEVGVLLADYALSHASNVPLDKQLVITTVVSSPLLRVMAEQLGAQCETVLTGFKWIANRALELEASEHKTFLFGYEEALGYTVGTAVRDKDGISAALVFAELAAVAHANKRTVLQVLESVYRRFGLYVSGQENFVYKGITGASTIRAIMAGVRDSYPDTIGGVSVTSVTDLQRGERHASGVVTPVNTPRSNVIAFELADRSRVTLRPSGTEPKLKVYLDVYAAVPADTSMTEIRREAEARLEVLRHDFVQRVRTLAGA